MKITAAGKFWIPYLALVGLGVAWCIFA